MSSGIPTLRPIEDVLAAARKWAAVGWRPTHQEVRQLVEHIDQQNARIAELASRPEPLGYLVATPALNDPSVIGVGTPDLYDSTMISLLPAPPVPMEVPEGYRVVAVYEAPE